MSKKSSSLASSPRFSKKFFGIFGAVFAAIGIYTIINIFASPIYINYYGVLTASQPTASYSITTGSGPMNVSFSNNTADVTLTITDLSGKSIYSALSKGKKDVVANLTVAPSTYTFTLSTAKPFTSKKGYSVKITYPEKDITTPTAAITLPLSSQTVAGIVDFSANSTDESGIAKVDFYINSVLLGSDITSPYSIKWDTKTIENGTVNLSVKSYDTAGNVATASGVTTVNNAAVVPVGTRRFPGDPNPKVTGKAYWGSSIGGNGDPAKHETPTGKSLSVRRTFWQWDAAKNTSSSMYKSIQDDLDNNRLPFVSFKTPGWTAMGNGTYDADLDKMLKQLDSYGKPIWLTAFHEPEGGAGSNVPNDPDGAPAWRAMQTRIRQRMTAVKTKNIAFMPILMSYTWSPASGRTPNDWWVPGIWDAYIVDHYRDNVSGDMFTAQWNSFVAWIEAKGLPYGTGEWGNRGSDAQSATEMQAFWDWGFKNKKDVIVHSYFDSGLNSPNGSWELTGEQLKKFQEILKTDKRVQRISDL